MAESVRQPEVKVIRKKLEPSQIRQVLNNGDLDAPVLFAGAASHWPCMSWAGLLLKQQEPSLLVTGEGFEKRDNDDDVGVGVTVEELGRTRSRFRIHRRPDASSPPGSVVWEGDCQYVEDTFTGFAQWVAGAGNEKDGLRQFDPATHVAYADYKYFSELFADHNTALESLQFEDFGVGAQPDNIAFWMGTAGSYTPCHQDCYGYNLVVQVAGTKRWTLFPPDQTQWLYPTRVPYEESSVFSQVLVNNPDLARNPLYARARKVEVLLRHGDVLFVPWHWWHFVESLETSISVNQWFELKVRDTRERVSEALVRTLVSALKQVPHSDRHAADGSGSPPALSAGAAWLNPTEGVWAPEDNLEALHNSLEDLVNADGKDLPFQADEFSSFVVNSLACKSLGVMVDNLIEDWRTRRESMAKLKRRKTE